MKRCPQCEFIYEDDQNCCDMDGIALVLTQTTPLPIPTSPKRNGPRRSLLSVLGVVLGVVILAIAYASLERAVTGSSDSAFVSDASVSQQGPQDQSTSAPAEQVVSPAVEPEVGAAAENPSVSMVSETAKTSRVAASDPNARELALKSIGTEPLRRNRLGTRGVVMGSIPEQPRIDSSRPQSEMIRSTDRESEKKDSKVVSIVKKTGRLLKKPFKL
jgi:hypothetical protein